MSMFDDMAQGTAWDSLAAVHGRSVAITPAGGSESTITGIWKPNELLPDFFEDGRDDVERGILTIHPDDAPSPVLDALAEIDSVIYAVEQVGKLRPFMDLQLVQRTRKRFGASQNRRDR